jgi:hypothetical protein
LKIFEASAEKTPGEANIGSWWNELQQAVIVLNRPVTPCVISQRFAEETVLLWVVKMETRDELGH